MATAKIAEGYLLRVHRYADFVVTADGGGVACHPIRALDDGVLGQIFVDVVLPQVLQLFGAISIHASGIALDEERAIAFIGPSGAGKSTLAASLSRAPEEPSGRAIKLAGDDCLTLRRDGDRVLVMPSYPSARLLPDSTAALFGDPTRFELATPRTPKRRVFFDAADRPLRLVHVFRLNEHDAEPRVDRLSKRDALFELLENLHRLDPFERLEEELDALDRLVTVVPVSRLYYRRRFDEIDRVQEAILDAAERP